ncbi:hypothetical protein DPMN_100728 [Dreissena polymorpha]|uniref:Uncharacterized protein n=1 Tax=Dreissena polymorpha TaxID=45954 RepID=A0A9D4LHU2_DREPO|nr:hypothetical protein DPMN_100728 [Dreissena polymorpha]
MTEMKVKRNDWKKKKSKGGDIKINKEYEEKRKEYGEVELMKYKRKGGNRRNEGLEVGRLDRRRKERIMRELKKRGWKEGLEVKGGNKRGKIWRRVTVIWNEWKIEQ